MSETRERLLDALETLLGAHGPAAATLDAVAAEAGTSKGGLLYHFASKEALHQGLLDRLRERAEAGGADPEADASVAGFLATSADAGDAYSRTLLAALRLPGTSGVDAQAAIAASLDRWAAPVTSDIADPSLARLITLAGDGLYLRALLGIQAPSAATLEDIAALLTSLTENTSTT